MEHGTLWWRATWNNVYSPLSRILENTVINKTTICWVETDNDFKMYWMVANKVKPEVTDYKHVFFEQSL